VHQAVRVYLANQRQGTASTKTRGEVSGSGAKPWRQKGTGRARAGTRTSPLWTGGGIIFGPEPRDHHQRLPKALRRLALRSVLRARLDEGALAVVSLEAFDRPRTARLARALAAIRGAAEKGREVLLLTAGYEENLFLSGRNVPGLTMKQFRDVTAYEVLRHSLVLIEDRVLTAGSDAPPAVRPQES
jgi:large subunit ribosomal protein L4